MTDGEKLVARIMAIRNDEMRERIFRIIWAFAFGREQTRDALFEATQNGGIEAIEAVLREQP